MTEEFQRLIGVVRATLDALPENGRAGDDHTTWRMLNQQRQSALLTALDALAITEGVRYRLDFNGGMFKLGGVKAKSTSGLDAAMRNWMTAVRKRMGENVDG